MARTSRLAAVAALAASLAAPHGEAAARGSAEASLHGKRVVVEYGRVALAGRSLEKLLAELPEDRVWRAGADEVTTLTTELDLSVDSLSGASCTKARRTGRIRRIPAGTYSLYVSAPPEGDWSLILNSDPGIDLGTLGKLLGFAVPEADAKRPWPHLEGYNPNFPAQIPGIAGKELARVVMRTGVADPPLDAFTMRFEPAGEDALTLNMAWGDRSFSLDLHADLGIEGLD